MALVRSVNQSRVLRKFWLPVLLLPETATLDLLLSLRLHRVIAYLRSLRLHRIIGSQLAHCRACIALVPFLADVLPDLEAAHEIHTYVAACHVFLPKHF